MTNKHFPKALALVCALIFAPGGCGGESRSAEADPNTKSQASVFAMDTYITITAYGENGEAAIKSAEDRITELEGLWSVTSEGSEIYALDRNGSADVSPITAELIQFAVDMNIRTRGALDITLYPVLRAWGFTTGEYRVPADDEISALLENTGVEKIGISGNTVTLPEGMQIDLGAIAKGYSGDIAAQMLKDAGIRSAILDLGGNIQTVGDTKPDGSPWTVGVRSPFGDGTAGILKVGECAVITSGGYERYFIEDGVVYKHILDPATGRPAESGLESATVIGSEGRLCDALSTSLYVMGVDGASEFWRASSDTEGFEMVLINSGGEIFITEGLEDSFTPTAEGARVSVIRR